MVATVQTQVKKHGTASSFLAGHAQTPLTSFSALAPYQLSQESPLSLFSQSSHSTLSSPSPLTHHTALSNAPPMLATRAPTVQVRIQSPVTPQTAKATGEQGDEAEREAQTAAQQVEHAPTSGASPVAPPPASSNPPPQDGGQPLDSPTRSAMEPLFGHSFSHVRIHSDMQAAHAAQSMQARAYTTGSHIYFNRGEYAPTTSQGKHLLAHELTHVVQQSHASPNSDKKEEQPVQTASLAQHFAANNAFEREARSAAAAAARGERVTVFQRTEQSLPQREEQQSGNKDTGIIASIEASIENEIWDLVRKHAPSLEPILRKGVFAWLEEHITAAIQGAFDTLMAPVRTVTGVVQQLSTHFSELLTWMKGAAEQIKRGDCSAITEATQKIQQVIDGFASPIIDKVKELAGKVGNFFKGLWDQFGAPIWDWLKKVGGEAWAKIQEFATSIWDWTQPVRDLGAKAWKWIKDKLGIGDGPDGQNGLLQWVEAKATEVWNKIKATLEPIKKPLMVIGGYMLLLSPAGPFIAIGAAIGGLIVGIRWIHQHLSAPNGVVNARVMLQKVIIPQILGAVNGFTGKLTQIATSITEHLNGVMGSLGNLMGALGASVLKFAVSAIQWVADQFKALVDWANTKLNALVEWVTTGLERLHTFLQPVLDFLGKVASVVGDILQLPFLIAGQLWHMIPACIRDPFVNFLIQHILSHIPMLQSIIAIPNIWEKLKTQAMTIIQQIFKQGDLTGALVSIFKLLLTVLQIPLELVTGIFTKAVNAFDVIMKDPIGFLKNILGAIKQGFMQFFGNVGKHLLAGVAEWFFSSINEDGGEGAGGQQIHAPRDFSLSSIFTFAMEVLDISEEKIFKKLEEKIGPEKVKMLRSARNALAGAWEWITVLVKEGPGGLWRKLTEKLSDLWHMLLDGIIGWVTQHIIQGAMKYLIGLLIPSGVTQIVEGIIGIYKSIQSAVKYAAKILQIVDTILDSIIGIAQGTLGPVATLLENALARGLPVVIGFLANLLDLDDIGSSIKDIVGAVRESVDAGIDWLIDKAIEAGSAFLEAVGLKDKGDIGEQQPDTSQPEEWWKAKKEFTEQDNSDHTIYFSGEGENATLMIASTPTEYTAFIERIDTKDKPELEPHKQKALGIAGQIDSLRKAERGKGVQKPVIVQYLNALAEEVKVLADATGVNPPSVINYGSTTSEGGATLMHATILSSKHPEGSSPTDKPAIWQKANRRLPTSSYIQGHLLNEELGGPGRAYNLTPITGVGFSAGREEGNSASANAQHAKIEAQIKTILDQGKIVRYTVDVSYGTHPVRSFQRTLQTRIGTPQEQPDDKKKLEIMNYEQENIARYFNINASIIRYEGSTWVQDEVIGSFGVGIFLPQGDFEINE